MGLSSTPGRLVTGLLNIALNINCRRSAETAAAPAHIRYFRPRNDRCGAGRVLAPTPVRRLVSSPRLSPHFLCAICICVGTEYGIASVGDLSTEAATSLSYDAMR